MLLVFLATGCSTHKIDVQPIKVEPIQLTLDINVKVQQEHIEDEWPGKYQVFYHGAY